jgi:hypothetical protein
VTKVALIIPVILFGGGFYYGGSYIGDSLGTGLLIDLIVFLPDSEATISSVPRESSLCLARISHTDE